MSQPLQGPILPCAIPRLKNIHSKRGALYEDDVDVICRCFADRFECRNRLRPKEDAVSKRLAGAVYLRCLYTELWSVMLGLKGRQTVIRRTMPSISTISSLKRPRPPNGVNVHPTTSSRFNGQSSRSEINGNRVGALGMGLRRGMYWNGTFHLESKGCLTSRQ